MMAGNPGTGGGKIRSRRAPTVRTPYARAPSQRKSLLGRVTDSFKSMLTPITPRWLASRMGAEESSSPQLADNRDTDSEAPSSSVNHQESHNATNNNSERSRHSRPLSRTSSSSLQHYVTPPDTPPRETTPSAAASAGGRGKEGLLKHLALASKRARMDFDSPVQNDSSFLRSEMSVPSANDNNSVASTSRWSSSAQVGSQRDLQDTEPSQKSYWSSPADSLASSSRAPSRQQTTMSSHKRPRFNPALFGTSSLSASKSSEVFQSSFYQGPVQFGGASASGRSLRFATPYKIPTVTKVKVRHVSRQNKFAYSSASPRSSKSMTSESSAPAATGMSSTAKKILQTLEKMSGPTNDKTQTTASLRTPSSYATDRMKRRTASGRSMLGSTLLHQSPSTAGLASPARSRRSRTPLANSLLVRKDSIRAVSADDKNSTISEFSTPARTKGPSSIADSRRGTTASTQQGPASSSVATSKLKTRSQFRSKVLPETVIASQKEASEAEVTKPNLPNVALPVSSLPSFNFERNRMTSTPAGRGQEKKAQPEFSFASPVVKTAKTERVQTSTGTPKFQFTSPPSKGSQECVEHDAPPQAQPSSEFVVGSKPDGASSLRFVPDTKALSTAQASKRRSSPLASPSTESGQRPAESLKSGSVLDILGGKKKAAGSGSTCDPSPARDSPLPIKQTKKGWTCDACMVPNDDTADSCVACTSSKPGGGVKKPSFSIAMGQKKGWDCGTCMVPNDADAEKCVACEEPRPGSAAAAVASNGATFKSTNFGSRSTTFSFGIPQKKDTGGDSFATQFKKPEGSWECNACLVRNDSASEKCAACQTLKPGSAFGKFSSSSDTTLTAETPRFKFGISSPSGSTEPTQKPSLAWGDIAKKPASTWDCEVCMVPNPDSRETCEACTTPKPGTRKEQSGSLKFEGSLPGLYKFGIPNANALANDGRKDESAQPPTVDAPVKPTFSFGAPVPKTTAPSSVKTPATSFSFGQRTAESEVSQMKKESVGGSRTNEQGLFVFGAKKGNEQLAAAGAFQSTGGSVFADSSANLTTARPLFGKEVKSQDCGFGSAGTAIAAAKSPENQTAEPTSSVFRGFGASKKTLARTGGIFGGSSASMAPPPPSSSTASPAAFDNSPAASTFPAKSSSDTDLASAGGFSTTTSSFGAGGGIFAADNARTFASGATVAVDCSSPVGVFAGSSTTQIFGNLSSEATATALKPSFNFGAGADGANKSTPDKPQSFNLGAGGGSSSATDKPPSFNSGAGSDGGGGSTRDNLPGLGFQFGSSNSEQFTDAPSRFTTGTDGGNEATTDKPLSGFQFGSRNSEPAHATYHFGAGTDEGFKSALDKPAGFQFGLSNSGPGGAAYHFGAGSQQNRTVTPPVAGFNHGATDTENDLKPASGAFQLTGNSAATAAQTNGLYRFGADSNRFDDQATTENKPFAFGVGNTAASFNFTGEQNSASKAGPDATGFSATSRNPFGQSANSVRGRRKLQARRKPKK